MNQLMDGWMDGWMDDYNEKITSTPNKICQSLHLCYVKKKKDISSRRRQKNSTHGKAVVLLRLAGRKGYVSAYLSCWHVVVHRPPTRGPPSSLRDSGKSLQEQSWVVFMERKREEICWVKFQSW